MKAAHPRDANGTTAETGTKQRRFVPVAAGLILTLSLAPGGTALQAQATPPPEADGVERRVVEIALCFDTSGSMEPSIDAARVHLWGIVDDLAALEPTPRVRVALLSYGNNTYPKDAGWVRVHGPLTPDLDAVYGLLFELEAGGSEEYVTRVVRAALEDLDWSEADDTLRFVFVIGNEEADQDPMVLAEDLAPDLEDRGIALHPIFVGGAAGSAYETWQVLGEILQVPLVTFRPGELPEGPVTPVDEELASLGQQLTSTYLPRGEDGIAALENQEAQDDNAASIGVAVEASRAVAKAGPLYAGDWDLVDAFAQGTLVIDDVPEAELPPAVRRMTLLEREEHLFDLAERRRVLREKIRILGRQREQHLQAQRAAGAGSPGDDLRELIRRSVRERIEAQGLVD